MTPPDQNGLFPLEDELEQALDDEYPEDPFIDVLAELDETEEFDLPKGYGRD